MSHSSRVKLTSLSPSNLTMQSLIPSECLTATESYSSLSGLVIWLHNFSLPPSYSAAAGPYLALSNPVACLYSTLIPREQYRHTHLFHLVISAAKCLSFQWVTVGKMDKMLNDKWSITDTWSTWQLVNTTKSQNWMTLAHLWIKVCWILLMFSSLYMVMSFHSIIFDFIVQLLVVWLLVTSTFCLFNLVLSFNSSLFNHLSATLWFPLNVKQQHLHTQEPPSNPIIWLHSLSFLLTAWQQQSCTHLFPTQWSGCAASPAPSLCPPSGPPPDAACAGSSLASCSASVSLSSVHSPHLPFAVNTNRWISYTV